MTTTPTYAAATTVTEARSREEIERELDRLPVGVVRRMAAFVVAFDDHLIAGDDDKPPTYEMHRRWNWIDPEDLVAIRSWMLAGATPPPARIVALGEGRES